MIPLRASGRAAASAGLTAGFLALAELDVAHRPARERPAAFERHARRWARAVLWTVGLRLHVQPPPRSDAVGPRLVVANHRTTFDALVLLALFGGRFVSRGDVAGWPLIGRGARGAGVVFVDRSDRASGATAIRTTRRLLRGGHTVIIFPEGTTHAGDEVYPFLAGAFAAARGLEVDVIPVGLAYPAGTEWDGTGFVTHARQVASRRRTDVGVRIGAALRLGQLSAAAAADRARDEVQGLVREARRLVP